MPPDELDEGSPRFADMDEPLGDELDEEPEPEAEEEEPEGIVDDTPEEENEEEGVPGAGDGEVSTPAPDSASTSPNLPAIALQEVYTEAQIADMKENHGFTDAMIFYMAQGAVQAAQRMEGSMLQSAGLYQQTLQQSPDYERVVGPRIRQHLSATVGQNVRHTQEGINQAMALTLLEEANAEGSPEGFFKALQRHAQLANPKMRPITQPAQKLPTQRPQEKIPAPSVSGTRGPGRPVSVTSRAGKLLGVSARSAEDLFEE